MKPILETGINRLKAEIKNKIGKNWKPVHKIETNIGIEKFKPKSKKIKPVYKIKTEIFKIGFKPCKTNNLKYIFFPYCIYASTNKRTL